MSRPTPETDACDLLSPNGEEAGNADYQRMLEHAKKLEGQRDELAEALASLAESAEFRGYVRLTKTGNPLREAMRKARKALATKEGGA